MNGCRGCKRLEKAPSCSKDFGMGFFGMCPGLTHCWYCILSIFLGIVHRWEVLHLWLKGQVVALRAH